MSTFEEAIVQTLNADGTVAGLVSGRVTVGGIETDMERPYVSILRESTVPGNTIGSRNALSNVEFTVSSYAESVSAAHSLSEAVRAVLDGFSATVAVVGGGSVVIKSILWTDEQQVIPRIGTKTYRLSSFYSVWGDI